MTNRSTEPTSPQSLRQQQTLEIAAAHPDASIEEIAARVSGATPDHVEEILETFGDPGTERTGSATEDEASDEKPGDDAMTAAANAYPTPEELSEKERETLRAIAEQPAATQREIADVLGISSATVNTRVNGIDGFDWDNREAFVTAVLESTADETTPAATAADADGASAAPTTDGGKHSISPNGDTATAQTAEARTGEAETADERASAESLAEVMDRLTTIEDELATLTAAESQTTSVALDAELAHKVLHACLEAEYIAEDEELQILEAVID